MLSLSTPSSPTGRIKFTMNPAAICQDYLRKVPLTQEGGDELLLQTYNLWLTTSKSNTMMASTGNLYNIMDSQWLH